MTTSWLEIATPINAIQEKLHDYFTSSGGEIRTGGRYDFSNNLNLLQNYPNTLVIDCTGFNSVLRDQIQPENRIDRIVEHVLICTFIFNGGYACNELCKYNKNIGTRRFRMIPAVDDTYIEETKQTFITCLITIEKHIFDEVATVKFLTYDYLREYQHEIYDDLNIFLRNLSSNIMSRIFFDTMEFIALPLNLYRAKKMGRVMNDSNLNQLWILLGDAALGAPYFQTITKGFEAAIYFAYLFKNMKGNIQQIIDKYEDYMEKLWLIIQMRSKEIQRNKEILQALCADDRDAVLRLIKIY